MVLQGFQHYIAAGDSVALTGPIYGNLLQAPACRMLATVGFGRIAAANPFMIISRERDDLSFDEAVKLARERPASAAILLLSLFSAAPAAAPTTPAARPQASVLAVPGGAAYGWRGWPPLTRWAGCWEVPAGGRPGGTTPGGRTRLVHAAGGKGRLFCLYSSLGRDGSQFAVAPRWRSTSTTLESNKSLLVFPFAGMCSAIEMDHLPIQKFGRFQIE